MSGGAILRGRLPLPNGVSFTSLVKTSLIEYLSKKEK